MLEIEDIDVFYGELRALHDLSLSLEEGSYTVLLGPNGAGKTTLLKTISGILTPRSGHVRYRGQQIDGNDPGEILSSGISHIPEGARVFPKMTVEENLLVGGHLIEDKQERYDAIEQVYQLFPRLEERCAQLASQLSGGERQMLAIGRGLMIQPQLLLIDEPSLGLAPSVRETVFDKFEQLQEQGVTILLAEQNAEKALEAADYGYVLDSSRLVVEGSATELRQNDDVREAYLGV